MNIAALRQIQTSTMSIEELALALGTCELVVGQFEQRSEEAPEWLGRTLADVERMFNAKLEERREAEASRLRTQLEGLKSRTEVKADLERKLAKLTRAKK